MTPTTVIFRRWCDGGKPFALFPLSASADDDPDHCTAWAPGEGHHAADAIGAIRRSRPATPQQAADMVVTLEQFHGYTLEVAASLPRGHRAARAKRIAATNSRPIP